MKPEASQTTTATFGADFVVGAVDGSSSSERLSTTIRNESFNFFTGEDSLDLTIETGVTSSPTGTALDMNGMSDAFILDGISYTFPLIDNATVMVGDSTDVSALLHVVYTALSLIYMAIVVQVLQLV